MLLQIRMFSVVAAMFALIYALLSIAGAYMGFGNFIFYAVLATGIMLVQFMVGPKIVEWTMGVKYVSKKEAPKLHKIVGQLAEDAGLPKPKVAVSNSTVPNAFAFGRWKSDSRVCVTKGLLDLLDDDELKAVLGHEMSHIRHRDVLVITLISVIPMIAWYMAWNFMFSGGDGDNRGNAMLIGVAAFGVYMVTNLLVLYASRVREYYADKGSVELGSKPNHLASALYKLVCGSAKASKRDLKHMEGMKAFFANDPSRARDELRELKALDKDMSGDIDSSELRAIREKNIRIEGSDKWMELLSTHPNMLKRVKALSRL